MIESKVIKSRFCVITHDKDVHCAFIVMDQYAVKEPGCLNVEFGKEAEHGMIHGGTLFRDTCSKYMFVKTQVYLGFGRRTSPK